MKKLLCLILALAIISSTVLGALTASYTPPRMTKKVDVYPLYGQIAAGVFHVQNNNEFPVNISTSVSHKKKIFLKEEFKNFELQPGGSRNINFLMHLTQVGNYSMNIATVFSAEDEPSMSGGSDIKIEALFKELPEKLVKGNKAITRTSNVRIWDDENFVKRIFFS